MRATPLANRNNRPEKITYMAIKAQRSSDAAAPRPYWADREARNSRDDRRRAPPITVDDPRRRYHAARDGSSGEVKSPDSPRRVPPTPAPTPTAITPRAHRAFFFDAMRHKVSKKKKRTQTSIDSVEFDLTIRRGRCATSVSRPCMRLQEKASCVGARVAGR